jgi:hypothetical protein
MPRAATLWEGTQHTPRKHTLHEGGWYWFFLRFSPAVLLGCIRTSSGGDGKEPGP